MSNPAHPTDQKGELRVEVAQESDSDKLKNFVIKQPFLTNSPMELVVDRKGSFFDKYRLQTDDFVTFKMVDEKDEIEGIASILYRKTLLNGEETQVGFATDLRIANSRQAIVQWPEKLLPAMTESAVTRNCDYVFSIMNSNQTQAYNALIRPRSSRRHIPRYYFYRKYDLITIHGKVPFTDLPFLKSIKIAPMSPNDLEPLASYLKSRALHKPLSFPYSVDLLLERFKKWKGFDMHNFLIAKDSRNNIIGCVAPWKASHILGISVLNYTGFGETIYEFSKWMSYFGFVKRLPAIGGEVKMKFLTHLYADNPDIFGALLAEVFRTTQKDELLSYPHFNKTPLTMPPKNFLSSKLPFSIYTILPPEKPLPDFLQLHKVTPPPEIEPILV
ncbi:MAG: hypothetical protein V4596_11495 [Bdellovibrionota bacterium]